MIKYGYARVSTIDQQKNHSFDNQRESLKKSGVKDEHIFEEVASAKNMEREELQKLLNLLEPHDEIVIHRLDRLARNSVECLKLIDELDQREDEFFGKLQKKMKDYMPQPFYLNEF